MNLFTVKKRKNDNDYIIQMPMNTLLSIVAQIIETMPLKEFADDDKYILRMSSKGLLEFGYADDKWKLS